MDRLDNYGLHAIERRTHVPRPVGLPAQARPRAPHSRYAAPPVAVTADVIECESLSVEITSNAPDGPAAQHRREFTRAEILSELGICSRSLRRYSSEYREQLGDGRVIGERELDVLRVIHEGKRSGMNREAILVKIAALSQVGLRADESPRSKPPAGTGIVADIRITLAKLLEDLAAMRDTLQSLTARLSLPR